MPFLKALVQSETQTASSEIWTLVTNSISYDNNCAMYFKILYHMLTKEKKNSLSFCCICKIYSSKYKFHALSILKLLISFIWSVPVSVSVVFVDMVWYYCWQLVLSHNTQKYKCYYKDLLPSLVWCNGR